MPDIIYEDNSIIVVAKPCNVPVQADISGDEDLLTQVKQYVKEKYNKPGNVYIGMVHRLDRPAGGIVVFARNSKSAERLSAQVRTREMHRVYYAVVRGIPKENAGRLENYLVKQRDTNNVSVVPATTEGAKQAILDYQVIETLNTTDGVLTLVEVTLQTGRSHQIRVQMANIGCPLWGDQRYGNAVNKKGQQLALWAVKLSLTHPITKEKRTFICHPLTKVPWDAFSAAIKSRELQ